MTLFADHFLAGAVLTLLLPTLLLIVIAVFLHSQVMRVPTHTPTAAPVLPDAEMVSAAAAEEEAIGGDAVTGGHGPAPHTDIDPPATTA